jgi:hypothetical protein
MQIPVIAFITVCPSEARRSNRESYPQDVHFELPAFFIDVGQLSRLLDIWLGCEAFDAKFFFETAQMSDAEESPDR